MFSLQISVRSLVSIVKSTKQIKYEPLRIRLKSLFVQIAIGSRKVNTSRRTALAVNRRFRFAFVYIFYDIKKFSDAFTSSELSRFLCFELIASVRESEPVCSGRPLIKIRIV